MCPSQEKYTAYAVCTWFIEEWEDGWSDAE